MDSPWTILIPEEAGVRLFSSPERARGTVDSRILRGLLFLVLAVVFSAAPALANWVASGTFKYRDREFDETGFTGNEPALPIRLAKVEVRDANKNGGQAVLATTSTDLNGSFSVNVTDSSTRTIVFRVITDSSPVPGLFLGVTNVNGQLSTYAVTSPNFASHNPTVNLSMGTVTAVPGSGGEQFNMYDVALNSLLYLKGLEGSYPGPADPLSLQWEIFSGYSATAFMGNGVIRVGDPSGYNDTVIQHETGHYAREVYSATDSPGGVHRLTNCNQDLRLAWEEGWATFFGQAVRLHFGLPHPELYVKTTGVSGPGNLDFYMDVEEESPYQCDGSASEVVVQSALWDILDSASTADSTPGAEDAADFMAAPDSSVWDVMKNYVRTATDRTLEDFWDGWFVRNHGYSSQMRLVFAGQMAEFFEDAAEPNETSSFAVPVPSNGIPWHATYFRNQGNGAGTVDTDWFSFEAIGGLTYTVETRNLVGDANTSLVVYNTDGATQLAANDDRSVNNRSSFISFLAPRDGTFYVRSFHGSGYGIYGSYDLSVTPNISRIGGSAPPPGDEISAIEIRQIKD